MELMTVSWRWPIVSMLATSMMTLLTCCSGLTPYADVLSSLPEDEKLQLNNQWVHYVRQGSGDPIVLIHGFGASTFAWRDVQPVLAEQFDVIAIDLSGFGYTERPVVRHQYSVAAQRDMVFSVLDALGISSAHFVGHSYGGGVVLSAAIARPDRVRSIVLVDSATSSDAPRGVRLIGPLTPLLAWYIENFALRPEWIENALKSATFNDEIVTDVMVGEYLKRLEVEGLDHALRGLSTARGGEVSNREVGAITHPALIIWGLHDPVIPLSRGQDLESRLPNARLVTLSGSGHLPMEEEPQDFVEAVVEFLRP